MTFFIAVQIYRVAGILYITWGGGGGRYSWFPKSVMTTSDVDPRADLDPGEKSGLEEIFVLIQCLHGKY